MSFVKDKRRSLPSVPNLLNYEGSLTLDGSTPSPFNSPESPTFGSPNPKDYEKRSFYSYCKPTTAVVTHTSSLLLLGSSSSSCSVLLGLLRSSHIHSS